MNNIIDNLKERYESFIDEKEVRNFFFGLADYVRYIENTPSLYDIIKSEIKEKEVLLKERDRCEEKTLQELELSKKALLEIIRKNKISSEELNKKIEEFKLFEKGDIRISGEKTDNIQRYLWNIGKILYMAGYKKKLKDFIDENPSTGNIYIDNKNLVFSNLLSKRHKLDKDIINLRKNKLWGCWDYLKYVPLFWIDRKGFEAMPTNDLGAIDICFNLFELSRKTEDDSPDKIMIYINVAEIIADYRLYVKRIHLYLLEKISVSKKSEKEDNKLNKNNNVEKITIIKLKNGKNLIAVNDDYNKAKPLSLKSYRWKIFIKEVEEKKLPIEKKTNKGVSKEIADYFNYNTQKCPIYFKGRYKPTNIFSGYDSDTLLNPDIKIEIISEKSYLRRIKK